MATIRLEKITPSTNSAFRARDQLTLNKNNLYIGLLVWDKLGHPETIGVAIDPENNIVELTPDGEFSASNKRVISSVYLKKMQDGIYLPIGDNRYQWIHANDKH